MFERILLSFMFYVSHFIISVLNQLNDEATEDRRVWIHTKIVHRIEWRTSQMSNVIN